MGSSREDLKAFPADARREAGYQLDKLQRGDDPNDWKPMRSVGQGVREIRIHEESGALRVIYLAAKPEGVYVLFSEEDAEDQPARPSTGSAAFRGDVERR
jgi:phage-related protein